MIALIRECSFDAQEAINAVRYESEIKKRFPGRSSAKKGVEASYKIIQKGLAFLSKQSATLASSERKSSSGILPRRLDGRGGASVVRRRDATEPKEILMSKPKSKRQTTL
ncbi:MAG: hypothetical protein WB019_24390, partial [Pseudolabrys sp.]